MAEATLHPGQWSLSRAAEWAAARPWTVGFNFLPSTAVNFLEMWHRDGFDPATIERELGWAAGLGYNALRTNPHFLVWRHDRDGLLTRMETLAAIADRHGLSVVFCPFDDCGFGGAEPVYGQQPDPVPGVHNSRAVASPGRAMVLDRALWPDFEAYLRDLLGRFGEDRRVLFWDLYNEPGNRMIFSADGYDAYDPALTEASMGLMQAAFGWAREVPVSQPLTVGAWITEPAGSDAAAFDNPVDSAALDLSDIVTFHAYRDRDAVAGYIDMLSARGRPVMCTEWMARPVGSDIGGQLDLYRDKGVGCFQWGLVQGRTQTHLPWPEALVAAHGGQADRSVWFHDVLHPDGTPYRVDEAARLRALAAL